MSGEDNLPEFHRPIALDRVGTSWSNHPISATPHELAQLSDRFGVLAILTLKAQVKLRRVHAGAFIELDAALDARVIQSCVVTLEPMEVQVNEKFRLLFGPIGADDDDADEIELSLGPDDDPEPIEGGEIDIGEAVAQQLSLALDPYPRSVDLPEIALSDPAEDDVAATPENPFAALESLRTTKRS
jgi:uncharacterized metal-binding protein YceD (DUF177 family)